MESKVLPSFWLRSKWPGKARKQVRWRKETSKKGRRLPEKQESKIVTIAAPLKKRSSPPGKARKQDRPLEKQVVSVPIVRGASPWVKNIGFGDGCASQICTLFPPALPDCKNGLRRHMCSRWLPMGIESFTPLPPPPGVSVVHSDL